MISKMLLKLSLKTLEILLETWSVIISKKYSLKITMILAAENVA